MNIGDIIKVNGQDIKVIALTAPAPFNVVAVLHPDTIGALLRYKPDGTCQDPLYSVPPTFDPNRPCQARNGHAARVLGSALTWSTTGLIACSP